MKWNKWGESGAPGLSAQVPGVRESGNTKVHAWHRKGCCVAQDLRRTGTEKSRSCCLSLRALQDRGIEDGKWKTDGAQDAKPYPASFGLLQFDAELYIYGTDSVNVLHADVIRVNGVWLEDKGR